MSTDNSTPAELPATEFSFPLVPGNVKRFMAGAEAKSRDLWQVKPESIRPIPGFNVRVRNEEYFAHIRSLADSMKSEGFKQHKPLAGYIANEDGQSIAYIFDGATRLEAALLAISEGAEIHHLPVVVSSAGTSLEDLTVELVRSNEGKPLTPIEKAVVCKRLSSYGWENGEIARRLGFTTQYVADLLFLVSAPPEIQSMVNKNEVSASVAIDTMKKSGSKAVNKLAAAKERAQAAGKTKVTKKHVDKPAAPDYDATVTRFAPRMAELICELHTVAGDALPSALQRKVRRIAEELSEAKGRGEL